MSSDGQRIKWRRNIAENFNRLSRVNQRYRRETDRQTIDDRRKDDGITGSTVVLTCCKGDGQSQWKTPIFGPSQLGNPLTDFDEI